MGQIARELFRQVHPGNAVRAVAPDQNRFLCAVRPNNILDTEIGIATDATVRRRGHGR